MLARTTVSRPDLVLRLGFAGRRELPSNTGPLASVLETIFLTIGRQLSQTLANPSSAAQAHARISRYYSPTTPVLRLVSGLSEGADTLAIDAFGRARLSAAQYGWSGEVGAVLPFDIATYRRSRPEAFRPVFDDLAPKCSYILTLDGIYDKPTPDTAWAKHRRSRAYRTQSNILLRHSDLLLAVAHLDEAGGAGGTLETIRAALALEMLVILVSPDTGATTLLEPGDDLTNVLTSVTPGEWQLRLSDWVTRIIADPDVPSGRGSDESTSAGTWHASSGRLLDEYFDAPAIPPTRTMKDGKLVRSPSLHGRCWTWFENQCRRGKTPKSDPSLEPYASWRSRATSLNYHYAELYRGAFLLNYLLAVCAVLLAGISLVFLSTHAQSVVSRFVWKFERWRILPGVNQSRHHAGLAPKGMRHGETYQESEACGA